MSDHPHQHSLHENNCLGFLTRFYRLFREGGRALGVLSIWNEIRHPVLVLFLRIQKFTRARRCVRACWYLSKVDGRTDGRMGACPTFRSVFPSASLHDLAWA